MIDAPHTTTVLPRAAWEAAEERHREHADALTADHRARAARGEKHPIWDFLFTYYSYKPAVLRRWHPGPGVELLDAAASPRASWQGYAAGATPGSVRVDVAGHTERHSAVLGRVEAVLRSTARGAGRFDCFGPHEWAMVYRQEEHRHPVPLRLGQADTDAVVEQHDLRCTHYDAFRFFTADAVPRNATAPTRELQVSQEQPGCLHAGMDLYKWAIKLGPLLPGHLLLASFELARDIRLLDMQASPYDVTAWGYEPVAIETTAGKAEYVRRQRAFADLSNRLRRRMLEAWLGGGDIDGTREETA